MLWDLSNPAGPQLLTTLSNGRNFVNGLAFSSDSKAIASLFDDQIILWDINPDSWVEKACQRVGRNFTYTEWAQYFPNEPYRATCPYLPIEP